MFGINNCGIPFKRPGYKTPDVKTETKNSVVVLLRIEDRNNEFFAAPHGGSGRLRFSMPGAGEVGEFLDYIEDMSLLLGCPNCRSFDVQEVMVTEISVRVCNECGHTEHGPPPN